MNGVDVAVLATMSFSGMIGLVRGLVREVFGLTAWLGAGLAATLLFPHAQKLARQVIAKVEIADPVAYGLVFLAVLITLSIIARALGGAVRASALGGLDRTLGLVYGLARGMAFVVLAYVVAGTLEPMDHWPEAALEARTLPSIYLAAAWAAEHVPEAYRPFVASPPIGRTTTATELLHANPVGRALNAPLGRH